MKPAGWNEPAPWVVTVEIDGEEVDALGCTSEGEAAEAARLIHAGHDGEAQVSIYQLRGIGREEDEPGDITLS